MPSAPMASQPIAIPEPSIKKEDLTSFFTEFTKTIISILNQNQSSGNCSNNNNNGNGSSRNLSCHMCSGLHTIPFCKVVDEYIKAGKCKRNAEGKVVLLSGAWIPQDTPGNNFLEQIDKWHRQHPNQLAAVTLFNVVRGGSIVPASNLVQPASLFKLTTDNWIATLEAELFNLWEKKAPVSLMIKTRAQGARVAEDKEEEEAVAAARMREAMIEEVADKQVNPAAATQKTLTPQPAIITPEHPYRNTKDASFIPANNKPVNAPVIQKKNKPAYKTLPPVHDPAIAGAVYKRATEASITITQRELLSLSPEVCSQIRDATMTK